MENWKNIPGYEGMYRVSDLGNVARVRGLELKLLKLKTKHIKSRDAYRKDVGLSSKGIYKTKSVHRLVMITFNPVPNMTSLEVDHIDGNPLNNNLNNLQWVTSEENVALYFKRKGKKLNYCPHCNGVL